MINTPRKAQGIKFHVFYQNYLIIIKEYACMCNHILPVSTSPLTTLKNYSGAAAVPGEEYVFELYQQLNSVYMQTILSDHGRWKNDSTRTDLRAELRGPWENPRERGSSLKQTGLGSQVGTKSWFQSPKHASWQLTHPPGSLATETLSSTSSSYLPTGERSSSRMTGEELKGEACPQMTGEGGDQTENSTEELVRSD